MRIIPTYAELRKMYIEDLERSFDVYSNESPELRNFFREEIARRIIERQNDQMLSFTEKVCNMTKDIRTLTRSIKLLTIINLFLVVVSIALSIIVRC